MKFNLNKSQTFSSQSVILRLRNIQLVLGFKERAVEGLCLLSLIVFCRIQLHFSFPAQSFFLYKSKPDFLEAHKRDPGKLSEG